MLQVKALYPSLTAPVFFIEVVLYDFLVKWQVNSYLHVTQCRRRDRKTKNRSQTEWETREATSGVTGQ